jgi:arsenate reductase (thioredoxin)
MSPINVLFLCTGNSARSVLAEAILNHEGVPRFAAYSAGSNPTGVVNPRAIEILAARNYPAEGLASKSWSVFADGPRFDLIFTVCDNAAAEACPVWPGQPISAHWGIADPASVEGSDADKAAAFALAFDRLKLRIDRMRALPLDSFTPEVLRTRLTAIGKEAEIA